MADAHDATHDAPLAAAAWRGAVWTAAVAGAFSLVVAALLLANHVKGLALDPKDSQAVAELKARLSARPTDGSLKKELRAVDLRLRRDYFRRTAFASRGAWLLVGGLAVFLVALKAAADLRKALPMPQGRGPERGEEARSAARGRRWVTAAGTCLGVAAVVLAVGSARVRPPRPSEGHGVADVSYPSPEEIASNWPRFRGPGGLGVAASADAPMAWNGRTGEGIAWKTPVPLSAPNSPVVWGDHVFLSGATKTQRQVYCFDASSGKLLWQKPVAGIPGSPAKPPEVMDATGHAASTVATDGRRVYAIFANGDLAAFEFAGRRVWARNLGKPDNSYGHASSLTTWRHLLLVLFDQADELAGKSKLIAFEGATGRVAWQTPRPVGSTWATPIVVRTPSGEQIATVGVPWVIAYDPATGRELWKADIMDGEVAPSPIFANGMVLVAQAHSIAAALRTDGRGDVTETAVAWTAEDGLPDTCSPLATGELFVLVTAEGLVTCYDARTGKMLWEHDYETHCLASPTLVGDRVYLVTFKGVTIVLAAAREFRELARAELGEQVAATPAFVGGRIYIRGTKHLFCIGKKP